MVKGLEINLDDLTGLRGWILIDGWIKVCNSSAKWNYVLNYLYFTKNSLVNQII